MRSRNKYYYPDGIPNRVWGVMHDSKPLMLNAAFNMCLRTSLFLDRWKHACLALIGKPEKPEGIPSSYRPLCLLDDVEKILETMLVN